MNYIPDSTEKMQIISRIKGKKSYKRPGKLAIGGDETVGRKRKRLCMLHHSSYETIVERRLSYKRSSRRTVSGITIVEIMTPRHAFP